MAMKEHDMAQRRSAQSSPATTQSINSDAPVIAATPTAADDIDPVDTVLADHPELAEEFEALTRGEKLIRLRQRGLICFDVQ